MADDLSGYSDAELEAIISAADYSDEELEKLAGPQVGPGETFVRSAVNARGYNFGDEAEAAIGAGIYGAAKGLRSLLPGGVPEGAPGVGDVRQQILERAIARREAGSRDNRLASVAGTATGIVGSLTDPLPGKGISSLGLRGAAQGASAGALSGAGAAEGDRLAGAAQGALTGLAVGGAAGRLAGRLQDRIGRLSGRAAEVRGAEQTLAQKAAAEEANALRPAQIATVKAENAARLAKFREGVQGDRLSAKTASAEELARFRGAQDEAARVAAQKTEDLRRAAEQAAVAPTREKAAILAGLDSRAALRRLGRGQRAQEKLNELYDEAIPGNPGSSALLAAAKLTSEGKHVERVTFARTLKESVGKELEAVRDALDRVPNAGVSGEALFKAIRSTFPQELTEAQRAGLNAVEDAISSASKSGSVRPSALYALVKSQDEAIRYGSADTASKVVAKRARTILSSEYQGLVERTFPGALPQYREALRKYGLFADLEKGSNEILERVAAGKKPINFPRPQKITPVAPEPVVAPGKVASVERPKPQLLVNPPVAQGPSAEALTAAQRALQPSNAAKLTTLALPVAGTGIGYSAGSALGSPFLAGSLLGSSGGAVGSRIRDEILRRATPSSAAILAKVQRLQSTIAAKEKALEAARQAFALEQAQQRLEKPTDRDGLQRLYR